MTLARLLLIADGFASGRDAGDPQKVHACAAAAVQAGVSWVQLRDHAAGEEAFSDGAHALASTLRAIREDLLLSVNTRVAVATSLGAGLHVGWRGPAPREARRMIGDGWLSVAVHDQEEAAVALAAGADALVFGPVFATSSKPGFRGDGLDALAAVCRLAGATPVMALGGMRPERVAAVLHAGAHGVAVLSAILDATPPVVPIIVSAFHHALEAVAP